jgi:hypothetical protein
MLSVIKFKSIFGSNIIKVRYGNCDISCFQVVQRYAPSRRFRCGFLYTNMSIKEIGKKNGSYGKKSLYMKLRTPERGLFEIQMDNVQIKQVDEEIIWFHHDGISALTILKKHTKNTFSGF